MQFSLLKLYLGLMAQASTTNKLYHFSKPSFSQIGIIFLCLSSILFIATFAHWLLTSVGETEHRIDGIGIASSWITGTLSAVIALAQLHDSKQKNILQGNKVKALDSTANTLRYKVFEKSFVIAKASNQNLDNEAVILLMSEVSNSTQNIDDYLVRIRKYEEHLDICQAIAAHMEKVDIISQMQSLAKEACDIVISNLTNKNPDFIERLSNANANFRLTFYKDTFLYLSGWLKNSIKYDQPMPTMATELLERKLYFDAITFIRNERVDWFLIEDVRAEEIIAKYLDLLLNQMS